MKKNNNKKQVFYSMKEFEEKYFPEFIKKRFSDTISDSHSLGIKLANESLTTIRQQPSK